MWLLRALRIAAILTPIVPATMGYLICRVVGAMFFVMNVRARRNVVANLQHVDPHMPWIRREINALRVCTTVVTNYYDLIRLRSVDRESILDLTNIQGLEHVKEALQGGRGVIIVSGHIGNFSVMARLPAALGMQAALIAERVEPTPLYHYMIRLRSAMGIEVIPPGSPGLRRVVSLLRNNGVLLLAADRDVTERGQPVRFFDRETRLPAGPVVLAMRTGAALVPAYTLRVTGNHSRVVIQEPLCLHCGGCWEEDIQHNLQVLAAHLESMVRKDPGQWAVLQRVWPPTSRYGRSEGLGSADDAFAQSGDYLDFNSQRRESSTRGR